MRLNRHASLVAFCVLIAACSTASTSNSTPPADAASPPDIAGADGTTANEDAGADDTTAAEDAAVEEDAAVADAAAEDTVGAEDAGDASSGDGGPAAEDTKTADTACVADCAGKTCGDDGCGGSCGDCLPGEACTDGTCAGEQALQCASTAACPAGDDPCVCLGCTPDGVCSVDEDDCVCGDCAADGYCSSVESCTDDGVCDPYQEGCVCSDCAAHPMCDCSPACDGKVCGNNGCGGICGAGCQTDETCSADQTTCEKTGGSYVLDETSTKQTVESGTVPPAEACEGELEFVDCPPGSVAVGYRGQFGAWMDHIKLECRELNSDGTLGATTTTTDQLGWSTSGGDSGPHFCPDKMMLVGGDVWSGDKIDSITGRCQPLSAIVAGAPNSAYAASAPKMGTGGGDEKGDLLCPDGYVATGIAGPAKEYPCSMKWTCTKLSLALYVLDETSKTQTAESGTAPPAEPCEGELEFVDCPDGSVAVGYRGQFGAWMDHIKLECREFKSDGTLGAATTTTDQLGWSTSGGDSGPHLCPDKMMLVGGDVWSGDKIDSITGRCQPLSAIVAGQPNSGYAASAPKMGTSGGDEKGDLLCPDGYVATGIAGPAKEYPCSMQWTCAKLALAP